MQLGPLSYENYFNHKDMFNAKNFKIILIFDQISS